MAKRRRGWVAGGVALGVGAAVAATVAAEKAWVKRDRARADAFGDEPYGLLAGKPLGPLASFDGTKLHVEEIGTGPTVLMVHGFSLALTSWHHQMKDLSAHARMVLYDQRGHGRSGMPPEDGWSLDALARDLDVVVRGCARDEHVVLVGHSMGGMTLLRYAQLFPDEMAKRVRGLVLIDTTSADVMGGMLPGFARRIEATMQGLQEAAMRALAGRGDHVDRLRHRAPDLQYLGTRVMGFAPRPSPRQVDFVHELLAETPTETWLNLIPAMAALDVTEVVASLEVPVLVMVGMHDRLTPPHAAQRIARVLPDGNLVVLPGAGHMPMLEQHEQVTDHLRRFISRVIPS
ncbi:MAG TPA: alpha/beta hydrolase [Actinomycetota bacterium]